MNGVSGLEAYVRSEITMPNKFLQTTEQTFLDECSCEKTNENENKAENLSGRWRGTSARTIEKTNLDLFGGRSNANVGYLRYMMYTRDDPTLRCNVDVSSSFLTSL